MAWALAWFTSAALAFVLGRVSVREPVAPTPFPATPPSKHAQCFACGHKPGQHMKVGATCPCCAQDVLREPV
jgi:hypothetical protein